MENEQLADLEHQFPARLVERRASAPIIPLRELTNGAQDEMIRRAQEAQMEIERIESSNNEADNIIDFEKDDIIDAKIAADNVSQDMNNDPEDQLMTNQNEADVTGFSYELQIAAENTAQVTNIKTINQEDLSACSQNDSEMQIEVENIVSNVPNETESIHSKEDSNKENQSACNPKDDGIDSNEENKQPARCHSTSPRPFYVRGRRPSESYTSKGIMNTIDEETREDMS